MTLQGRSSQSYPFLQKYSITKFYYNHRRFNNSSSLFHNYNNNLIVYPMLMHGQPILLSTQLKLEENKTQDASQFRTVMLHHPISVPEKNNLEMKLKVEHSSSQKTFQRHRKQYNINSTKVSEGLKVTLNSKQIEIISKLLQKYAQKKQSQKRQSQSKLSLTQPSKEQKQIISKSNDLKHFSKDFFGSVGKRGKNVTFSQVIAVKKFRKDDFIEGLHFLPECYEGLNYFYKERQREDLINQRAHKFINPVKKQKQAKKRKSSFLQLCTVVLQSAEKEKLLS